MPSRSSVLDQTVDKKQQDLSRPCCLAFLFADISGPLTCSSERVSAEQLASMDVIQSNADFEANRRHFQSHVNKQQNRVAASLLTLIKTLLTNCRCRAGKAKIKSRLAGNRFFGSLPNSLVWNHSAPSLQDHQLALPPIG